MKRLQSLLAGALLPVFAAACSGGSGNALPSGTAPQSPIYTGPATLADFQWDKKLVAQSQYLGPVPGNLVISMTAGVTLQNQAGLLQYAQDASNPKSSLYRKFLTPQEIGARYGASQSDYASVAQYFTSYGINVGGWPQRLALAMSGSVNAFSKALGTPFGVYRYGTRTFVAPSGAPHFAKALPVRAFSGLAQMTRNRSYYIRISNADLAGLSPQQIAHGFDYSGAYAAGFSGTGINVGIVGTGPIDLSARGDSAAYAKTYKTALAPIAVVPAVAQTASPSNNNTGTAPFDPNPAGLATPPPVTAPCSQTKPAGFPFAVNNYTVCNPEDGEAQLDTQSVASLAPGSNVLFYLAYNGGTCVTSSGNLVLPVSGACPTGDQPYGLEGIELTDDEIQQAITDNTADALSLSYGLGETDGVGNYYDASGNGIGPSEFAALAAEGIAVFASSGDTGNEACVDNTGTPLATPCISYPAADPSVTAVGGVNIPLDNTGKLIGQITAWADQTTQGGSGQFHNDVGSGGGVSSIFAAPAYQNGLTVPAGSNPSSASLGGKRGIPDISMDADPASGPSIFVNSAFGGGAGASGGTSAAAPEMAAMWALVLQACKANAACATAGGAHPYRLGNPNALLYGIYNNGAHGLAYGNVFYDVLYGENQANGPGATPGPPITGCCTAGTGYDLVTGVGVPMAGHLITAVTGTAAP